ncbi:MAG: aminopeptidase, partial [Chitinophagaceae bacterium]
MKKIIFLLLLSFSKLAFAQDLAYTRKTLNTLSAKELWGRGYTKNGMGKAADFIEKEFIKMGLKPIQQVFSFPVNTFPGKMEVSLNGKTLMQRVLR